MEPSMGACALKLGRGVQQAGEGKGGMEGASSAGKRGWAPGKAQRCHQWLYPASGRC